MHLPIVLAPSLASGLVFSFVHGVFAREMFARRRTRTRSHFRPRVSVLKPLAGLDDDLEENLESFARLRYPSAEILLGVASVDDPAFEAARAFVRAHPNLDARVVLTDPDAALNPKVAQLIGLAKEARGEVLVISDSNVRVGKKYLEQLLDALAPPGVGLATSVIHGSGGKTLGALLENAQLNAYIAPIAVAAQALSGRRVCVGKSMAMRRADLDRVGGFAAFGGVLAEDDALARTFLARGYEVALCLSPIENRNVTTTVRKAFARHTRWAQMRKNIIPSAYLFEPLLSPMLVALATVAIAPSLSTARAAVAATLVQLLGATIAHRAMRGKWGPWRAIAIEPLRAVLLFACWMRAFFGARVVWRGHAYRMGKGSKLTPIAASPKAAATDARSSIAG